MSKHVYRLLFFIVLTSNFLQAQIDTAYTDGVTPNLSITHQLYYIEDPTAQLSFDTVQQSQWQSKFTQHKGNYSASFGLTQSDYWFKFVVKNGATAVEKFLEFGYPFLNELDVYFTDSTGTMQHYLVGDHFPYHQRQNENKNFIFDLYFHPHEVKTIFAHITSDGEVTSFPVRIVDHATLTDDAANEQLILGFYYGIVVFALFLSFFLGASLNENVNFRYFLYVVSVGIFQFSIDGLSFKYLWPNNVWLANHIIPMAGAAAIFFLIKFTQFLLLTKEHTPIICKTLNVVAGFIVALFVCAMLPNPFYAFSLKTLNFMVIISNLLILIAAIKVYRMDYRPSRYFLLAFLLLIVGSTLSLLKNIDILPRIFITEYGIQLGSGIEIIFLAFALSEKVRTLKDEKQEAQASLLRQLEENNRLEHELNVELEKKVIERTLELQQQKELVEEQKSLIEEKHKEITDSINYAERIQKSFMASRQLLTSELGSYFLIFQPKDVVSGDFYWAAKLPTGEFVFVMADSTGHGVPGAIMSILNISALEKSIETETDAGKILTTTRTAIIERLKRDGSEEGGKDGMDASLFILNQTRTRITYACANNCLWVIRKGVLMELECDKMPVGKHDRDHLPFTTFEFEVEKGDMVYGFTDGLPDQFGGPKGKKFKYAQLKQLLLSVAELPIEQQERTIRQALMEWKGSLEQVDDVTLAGIRI